MTNPVRRSYLRDRDGETRVAQVELFYDLVYVFAVTQLSDRLLQHRSVGGAAQSALLLAMVWLAWVYTTWVTNWLEPERLAVRVMLLACTLLGLLLSVAIPGAFSDRGLLFGCAYAVVQIGRSLFAVWALRGEGLRANYNRITAWCALSGALAVIGGVAHGHARELFWVGAVGVDLLGGAVGFRTPGLGRSRTSEWTIEGNHFAERCQAFVLIALGESLVVIGQTFSDVSSASAAEVTAFAGAFLGALALWWVYFDQAADRGAQRVAESGDPGRLGRSAYHLIHPFIVAGIIVSAAGDERVLAHPTGHAGTFTGWVVLGGTALFLAGHAAYKAVLWRVVPLSRIVGIVVLGLLGFLVPHVPVLALGFLTVAVPVLIAISDRLAHRNIEHADIVAEPSQLTVGT